MDEGSFQPSETMLRLYPEAGAGGYTRHDGFVEFYTRVNALLGPRSRILDLGAGRGQWADDGSLPSIAHMLRSFHERVESVVGVDVDPVVLNNPTLADAQVIKPGETLSFPDGSFDVVLADHVLEHIDKPDAASLAADISRILRPGGWFVARTPNKWGMIGIGARVVPNRLHTRALTRLQPDRQERDVFPVRYQMNTRRTLKKLFPEHRLHVYSHASEPRYFGNSVVAWRTAAMIDRLTPPPLAPTLMIFIQKPDPSTDAASA